MNLNFNAKKVMILTLGAMIMTVNVFCQSVTFAVIGDFGSGNSNETQVATLVKSWNPQFVITTGDDRYGSTNFDLTVGRDYCEFLKGAQSGTYCAGNGAAINSFFPSTGNHEYTDGGGITEYLNYFKLPGDGVQSSNTSGSEKYYDFVQGPIHFFVIDSQDATVNGSMATQQAWLQNQLAASTSIWNIVYFHHPPYSSSSSHGSTAAMRWPFAAWGADAVLNGHDHTYERLIVDGFPYMVNGLGGMSKYGFGTALPGSIIQYSAEYGAQKVVADNSSMTFSFVNVLGQTIDSYTIYKTIPPDNNAPAFTSSPITGKPDAVVAATYNSSISTDATDADSDPLTFSKVSGPDWLIVASSGALSGIPDNGDLGSNTFIVRVSDNKGGTDDAALDINVLASPPPPVSGTIDVRISGANDDVEQKSSDGTMYFTSTDIELGNDPAYNGDQSEGLLFRGINVPQGATITSAYVEFETDEVGSDITQITIKAQGIDNAPDFSSANFDLTSRQTTSASVFWDIPVWNTVDEKHQSPDISAVIQEIINRPGWVHQNSMAVIIDGTGTRTAEAYEGEPAAAALLHIEYTDNINNPPLFTSNPIVEENATEDLAYSSSIADNASDADADNLIFSKVSGPGWLTVGSSGSLSGTPSNSDVGTNSWIVKVEDGKGGSNQATLQINVINTNDAPLFKTNPIVKPDGLTLIAYNGTLSGSANDPDNDVLAYSFVSGPVWLTLSPDGSYSGIPSNSDVGPNSWQVLVDDSHGGTDFATLEINILDPSQITYCQSSSLSFSQEYISSVRIGNFTKYSSGSTYSDFTSELIELEPGNTYNLSLTPTISKKTRREYFRVWIDFNHNGSFQDTGELVFEANGIKSTTTGSINIPADAFGSVRMRVSMKYNSAPADACEIFPEGEVEDYTLTIGTVIPQQPVADFSANKLSVYVGDLIQFTDLSLYNPTNWLWNFGDGQTSTEANPTISYSNTGNFSVTLEASNNAGTDSETKANYIEVLEKPVQFYCEPTGIDNSGDYINQISINGIANPSGKSIAGYTFFTTPVFDLASGQSYSVNLSPYKATDRNFWRIWIDINGDGVFDEASETVFAANNKRGSVSGDIIIPSGITATTTRMRISMKTGGSPASCDSNFPGEVEDYTVNISAFNLKSASIVSGVSSIMNKESHLKVFPNPFTSRIHISLDRNEFSGNAEVKLMDITGKVLSVRNYSQQNLIMLENLNLKPGIYLIEVKLDDFVETKRLVKLR